VFQRADDGFSLVEVLIAMFLLSMIAIAVLPLLIGATRLSVANKDLATATAFANAQLAPLKAAFPAEPSAPTSCAALRAMAATDVAGPQGISADISVNACPAASGGYPASVPVAVSVSDAQGVERITLRTRIMVGAP